MTTTSTRLAAAERAGWIDFATTASLDRMTIATVGDATLLRTLGAGPQVNLVFGAPADPRALRTITRHYRDAGVASFLCELVASDPDRAARAAAAAELAPYRRRMVRLAREGGELVEVQTDLEIGAPRASEIVPAARIICANLGAPLELAPAYAAVLATERWHMVIARDAGVPVGAAMLFAAGDTAYLFGAATLPSHRGRGAQNALIRARIALATELGATLVGSHTGEPVAGEPQHSEHNMQRHGLLPVARYTVYVPV